jgi:predicted nucleotidyltransferase
MEIETLVALLAPRPEILEAYLFGSRARGDASAHSDVDVAVYVDRTAVPDAPFGYVAALTTEVIHALGRNEVDVVLLNDAPPLLYHRILRDGRRLVSRDLAATTRREGYALSRYCDYVPQLRKIAAAQRRRIEGGAFGR